MRRHPVEPVKYLFDQLKKNYAEKRGLFFENCAIADANGLRDFYRLRETSDPVPDWYTQLGSFHLEVILKHKKKIPALEKYLVREPVSCITLGRLLDKYSVLKIDLLHVDTEGHDYEILKQLDSYKIKPRAILYEHLHLYSPESKKVQRPSPPFGL